MTATAYVETTVEQRVVWRLYACADCLVRVRGGVRDGDVRVERWPVRDDEGPMEKCCPNCGSVGEPVE